jgi:hypothetical protein
MMTAPDEIDRRRIALLWGDDLEGSYVAETEQKVSSCPKCKAHWERICEASSALRESADGSHPMGVGDSIWPSVRRKLDAARVRRARDPEGAGSNFNGWVPALTVAAACLALFAVTSAPIDRSGDSLAGDEATVRSMLRDIEGAPRMTPAGRSTADAWGGSAPVIWRLDPNPQLSAPADEQPADVTASGDRPAIPR